MYFTANGQNDLSAKPTLWVTDGTSPGTLNYLPNSVEPRFLKTVNNELYFGTGKWNNQDIGFWKTDGTSTVQLSSIIRPATGQYLSYNGNIYFKAQRDLHSTNPSGKDFEHWVTDGTVAGTHLLSATYNSLDPELGDRSSNYLGYNGNVYFLDHRLGVNTLMKYEASPNSVANVPEKEKVRIYPNPSKDVFTIDMESRLIDKVVVKNIYGKTVLILNSQSNKIDLSEFSSGYYFINGHTKKGQYFVSPLVLKK